ncbi:A24 family peptidase [Trinickia violacea]|uniref:A24 family peptidase n=1 Tax=Trinickia violacea TaxID=2571746 RepID=UPI001586D695|nr:prepilin peptidase [Trinickia violacea]
MLLSLPPQPIPPCVIALTVVAASTDIVCRRIPNQIIGIGLIASLLVQVWVNGLLPGSGNWLSGAMTGFGLLVPLYMVRGMTAGDVKLLLMIGTWVGPSMTLYIALATFVIGGAWSLAFAVWHKRTTLLLLNIRHLVYGGSRIGHKENALPYTPIKSVGSLPYGVAIAAGTIGVVFASVA